MSKENPVVQVAKERVGKNDTGVHTLSTGVKVRLHPVSASLIADVQGRYEYPEVPVYHNEKKGRDEPNPNDPNYIRAVSRVDQQRGTAALDAVAMFGVELVDGMPDDDSWIAKLKLLGIEFDDSDAVATEFNYKKHVAIAMSDFDILTAIANIDAEDIAKAEATFPGDS